MDLEYKSPKLESFYSPNHRPVSPMWTEKDKTEDDNDATNTSDGEDQSSLQGNDVESNIGDMGVCDDEANDGCEEEPNNGELSDGLVWNDGIGTLVGSDLKFRMNSHGDIELIMDDFDLPCQESTEQKNVKVEEEHEVTTLTEEALHAEDLLNGKCFQYDAQSRTPTESPVSLTSETVPALDEQNCSAVKDYNCSQLADNSAPQENTDDLGVSDTVLKEDTGGPLYEMEYSKDDESYEYNKLQDGVTNTSHENDQNATPMCEVCGLPARLGNRFCSRQCLGRHAAYKRRTNQLTIGKKGKVGKKKSGGRGNERYLPHPDDILTVVHDNKSGEKNDLKIKIRWCQSVNENNESSYVRKEYSKQKVASHNFTTSDSAKGMRWRFSWSSYLEQEKAVAAPVDAFTYMTGRDAFPKSNPFQVGMSLEGVDPENEALICPLFISEIQGFRIRLSFYGYSETYDFWRNADCPLIFPCGFCKETNRTLHHPKANRAQSFEWNEVSYESNTFPAPKECFHISKNKVSQHKFKVGQKLEAVDKHNPSLVCVASINDIIGDQLLISFDGWSEQFDFWCSASSQLIHRVEWCNDHNIQLTVPRDWNESVKFHWGKFLQKSMSQAVDTGAFTDKHNHGFLKGMKLEAVDPRNRILIRVATIAEIKEFQVKIHFDGWSDMYDFWTFLEDLDLHPVGWCNRTGHQLEPPISIKDKSGHARQTSGCPIPGCCGIGHIKGAKFHNHYSEFGCPYSPQNLTKEHIKNRLSVVKYKRYESFDGGQVARTKAKVGRTSKRKQNNTVEKPVRIDAKRTRHSYKDSCEFTDFNGSVLRNVDIVSRWTVEEVAKFVEEVTNEPSYGKIFQREEMDGRALLMLTQAEILTIMRIKLGPAVKIYHAILNIKADS